MIEILKLIVNSLKIILQLNVIFFLVILICLVINFKQNRKLIKIINSKHQKFEQLCELDKKLIDVIKVKQKNNENKKT